eukprot:Gb_24763 [translate_table: standard]
MAVVRRFNKERVEEKTKYYSGDPTILITYAPVFNINKGKEIEWKDAIQILHAPYAQILASRPEGGIEYCRQIRLLSITLLNLQSKALSLPTNYLIESTTRMSRKKFKINFYPPCPQPAMTRSTIS